MESGYREGKLHCEIEPVIEAMGFYLVEMKHRELAKSYKVVVVVHRLGGVTVEDCASISHMIIPRLKVILERDDISIEVASSGTDRLLKSTEEFSIFRGRGVRILLEEGNSWQGGIIFECRDGFLYLQKDEKCDKISLSAIKKARLDATQEV